MAKLSKRAKANAAKAPTESMDAVSAFKTLKTFEAPKFDQSVEVVMHLGIDTKHADQQIRGSVSLPKGIGKAKKVIAFCQPDVVAAAKEAGAIEAGGEELVAKIEGGWFDFEVAIASPDMMRVLSKLGKVLGPKGLMPSPKNGTVTPKVAQAVGEFAAGKVEYRADKGGNIHAIIGKMSFDPADLTANFEHFCETIEKQRPTTVKGEYVKSVTVSGTMTPGVRVIRAAAADES